MTTPAPGGIRPDLTTAAGQFEYLTEGSVDVVRADELRARLERSVQKGEPLIVKTGFDPSSADIHLGHVVLIRKMKQFQDCGHQVVFVVGDFTAMIGDPTGRSKTRPQLSREQILQNAETYRRQAAKILDDSKTKFSYNSEWLDKLGSSGLIRLAAKYNVARMLERRDFRQRYEAGQSIAVHEFLYPLAQAYDSVALHADVELGGTDQLFNLNVGRDIMPEYGLPPQIVMTTPLLEGLDGVEKMSKSLGNYVGIEDPPAEMFGKLMSISDDLMWKYWMLVGGVSITSVIIVSTELESSEQSPQTRGETSKRLQRGRDFLEAAHASHGTSREGRPTESRVPARQSPEGRAPEGQAPEARPPEGRLHEGLPRIVGVLADAYGTAPSRLWIQRALTRLEEQGDQAVQAALEDLTSDSLHPKDLKVALARGIVIDFHGREAADAAEAEFRQVFTRHELPNEVREVVRPFVSEGVWLPKLMVELGLAQSNGEAMRLMKQGGVTVDGQRVDSKEYRLKSDHLAAYVIKVGKRHFVRVRFE